MSLAEVRHWVFDMDGTLPIAVHDFAAIRVALAIPYRAARYGMIASSWRKRAPVAALVWASGQSKPPSSTRIGQDW